MIEPERVALFVPPELSAMKLAFFNRIARNLQRVGGRVVWRDYDEIISMPSEMIPIVGCSPRLRSSVEEWLACRRTFIFWDRGYLRRPDHYRWTVDASQMSSIRNVPDDRLRALGVQTWAWNHSGRHIVVADTGPEYWDFFADREWVDRTVALLRQHTDREIRVRPKHGGMALSADLKHAHALVSHGSIAAVESVIMGCPVFVDSVSTARLVGLTDFTKIESPIYPDRLPWLRSLAYSQFSESEVLDLSVLQFL